MRVVPSSLLTTPPKIRTVSPSSGAPRQLPPQGGKPCIEPCSELLSVLYKIPPLGRFYRAPKKYRRTFWEEERQAQRAKRQTKCAVCHGALARRGRDDIRGRVETTGRAGGVKRRGRVRPLSTGGEGRYGRVGGRQNKTARQSRAALFIVLPFQVGGAKLFYT